VLPELVLLDMVFSIPRQEIGSEERLRNDLCCVEWDVKPYSIGQSIYFCSHVSRHRLLYCDLLGFKLFVKTDDADVCVSVVA